jgi:hypothetical protein
MNRSSLKSLATLLLLLCWGAVSGAEPLRLEAQVGQCEHGRAADGVWWSSYYPHQFDLRSSCWQLGASRLTGNWRGHNYGWRIAYVELGRVKTDATFTFIEPQYPGETGETCDPATYVGCLGRGQMRQRTRGLTAGGLLERQFAGWELGVEGGLYFYYSRFDALVTSVPDGSKLPPHHHYYGDWLMTPYLGLTARRGILFATARVYGVVEAHEHGKGASGRDCFGCTGITDGPAYQATVGIQISFK